MTRTTSIHRAAIGGAAVICGCLLVAACGAANPGPAAGVPDGAPAALAPSSSPAGHEGASGSGASAAGSGAAAGSSAGTSKSAVQSARLAPADQSIIYTASLTVRASDVMTAAKRAVAVATAAGGYVADENAVSGPSGKPRSSVELTLKIPVPSYQAALAQLSSPAIGKQLALHQQATDVTQQVADVTSLVTSQQDAISALQGLLKRAGSVSGLLQVQQQISSDESSLNSLQAQQRALNHETSYGTVSMTLVGPPRAVRHHHHHKPTRRGFLAGLAAGWRAMRHSATWLATAVGIVLPYLILVILLGSAGYAGRRRFTRRRAAG